VKTILVTGASGFIGMEVCYNLLSKGFKVIATDKQSNEFVGKENYTFIQANVTDKYRMTTMLQER